MGRLNRAIGVRSGEEPMVGGVVGLTFVTWAGLTIGQSSIEALLFSRYGVDQLPVLYLLLGLLLFLASLGVTAMLGRMARESLFVLMPLVLAALPVAGRFAVEAGIEMVYPGLWLFANLALLAQGLYLWGIAGLVTDTRQAKRLFPLFAAGGIAGAALGGLVTGPLARWLQPENLLLLWSGILAASAGLAAAVLARWGPRRGRVHRRRDRVTALGAVRDGWRTVRGSALLRWMSAGAVLFSVLLYSLYLPFSRAAVDRFPDAGELAGFLGAFSGFSTAVALLVSLVGANRLFSRFGTPAVLVAYTIAYTLGFAVLALNASFLVLVLVRFVQVVGMQGLANSAWEAMINVTPPERRDQARAFLNGVPAQAGTALAGVVLIVGQRSLQPRQLFLFGFGAAVLTAVTMWRARRSYAAAVADTLRAGRPHVFEDDQAEAFTGVREDAAAVSVAVAALSDTDPRVRRVAAEILGGLRNRELVTPLSASLDDPDAGVRAASVRALSRLGDPSVLPGLSGPLADSDAAVRLAAVQAMRSFDRPTPLVPLLDDPDPGRPRRGRRRTAFRRRPGSGGRRPPGADLRGGSGTEAHRRSGVGTCADSDCGRAGRRVSRRSRTIGAGRGGGRARGGGSRARGAAIGRQAVRSGLGGPRGSGRRARPDRPARRSRRGGGTRTSGDGIGCAAGSRAAAHRRSCRPGSPVRSGIRQPRPARPSAGATAGRGNRRPPAPAPRRAGP
jgi:hypothetical protein